MTKKGKMRLSDDEVGMPHICGMDTYGMKIMPQMSGIATFQDIYGMLIFEDEHAIDV